MAKIKLKRKYSPTGVPIINYGRNYYKIYKSDGKHLVLNKGARRYNTCGGFSILANSVKEARYYATYLDSQEK